MRSFLPGVRALVYGLVLGASAAAEEPEDAETRVAQAEAEVNAAIQQACALLIANQEYYVPDPPVGTLPNDELAAWQEKELARLADLREAAGLDAVEWPYEGVYRVGPDGRIPPGYRVGGTAIVCTALLEAPGFDASRREAVLRGVEFMLDMIHHDAGLAGQSQRGYDVRGWGQAYALDALLRADSAGLFASDADLLERVHTSIPHLLSCLQAGQLESGGWNYAGPSVSSPFMTGATLLALYRAQAAGYEVDSQVVTRALDALTRSRGPSLAYAYSGPLRDEVEPMQGASARSAIAELALYLGGRSDAEKLGRAVDAFFVEENWKALHVRKSQQGTHVEPYGVAPYYFFFGHTYAAVAAEHLPAPEERREAMRDLLWRTLEEPGGWNDRVFPRTESYSTAMAVLALGAKDHPKAPHWQPSVVK